MTHIIDVSGDIDFTAKTIEGEIVTEEIEVGGDISMPSSPYFTGEYVVTPSTETQIVSIGGKTAKQDITINPIPSNYGLITWDGSTLTVS